MTFRQDLRKAKRQLNRRHGSNRLHTALEGIANVQSSPIYCVRRPTDNEQILAVHAHPARHTLFFGSKQYDSSYSAFFFAAAAARLPEQTNITLRQVCLRASTIYTVAAAAAVAALQFGGVLFGLIRRSAVQLNVHTSVLEVPPSVAMRHRMTSSERNYAK